MGVGQDEEPFRQHRIPFWLNVWMRSVNSTRPGGDVRPVVWARTPRWGPATARKSLSRDNGTEGYRDHQTQTCDDEGLNVIVHVETRPAPEQDIDGLDRIHQGLASEGFRSLEHVVDGGYTNPDSTHHAAQRWGITLLGPVRTVPRASEGPGFAKEDFTVDWQNRTLTSPMG